MGGQTKVYQAGANGTISGAAVCDCFLNCIVLQRGISYSLRSVFGDSGCLTIDYKGITVDALAELGIILSAWYSRTLGSNTSCSKGIHGCPTSFLMCKG